MSVSLEQWMAKIYNTRVVYYSFQFYKKHKEAYTTKKIEKLKCPLRLQESMKIIII